MATHPLKASRGRVDFSGEFAGPGIVVGDHRTVDRPYGTVVQPLAARERPSARASARPQQHVPPRRQSLLDRDREIEAARRALADGSSFEFHGQAGAGKSALLAHLAASLAPPPDGVVHLPIGGWSADDVVQRLFDVFFTTDVPWTPGSRRAFGQLRDVRALVVLDDVTLDAPDVAAIVGGLPGSAFVLATLEPRGEPPTQAYPLRGLQPEAARALFERCLERPLQPEEDAATAAFLLAVERQPGAIAQGAGLVRDGLCPLADLAFNTPGKLTRRRVDALGETQRRLLAFLVELAPGAAGREQLAAAGAAGDPEQLVDAGLARHDPPGYAVDVALPPRVIADLPAVAPEPLLAALAGTAQHTPATIGEQAPVAIAALGWGRRAGAPSAVVDAARAIEGALATERRPGAWAAALAHGRAAAEQTGRTADLAHFLHQQGTWELCLGEPRRAHEALTAATALREQLGDTLGAAASRHNLEVMAPAASAPDPVRRGRFAPSARTAALTAGALAAGAVAGALVAGSSSDSSPAARMAPPGAVSGSGSAGAVPAGTVTVFRTVTVPPPAP